MASFLLMLALTRLAVTTAERDINTRVFWPVSDAGHLLEGHLKHHKHDGSVNVLARRDDPPITNTPQCDTYDEYFYVTPRNYTWQLQCVTNYDGTTIQVITTNNYSACIGACADYNRNNQPGACIAITFNGPSDGAVGQCTLWSSIMDVLLADEEGNIEDSALLVRGPDGTVYATPRPAPGQFSGAPTNPPNAVPVPTSSGTSTSTVFATSIVYVTSCPSGVLGCGSTSTPTTMSVSLSAASQTSTTVPISMAGPRPPPSSPPTSFPPSTGNGQTTYTVVLPFTEYIVSTIEVCPSTPGSCEEEVITSTWNGYRTELSCSPGMCTGAMIQTDMMADFAAATCVIGR